MTAVLDHMTPVADGMRLHVRARTPDRPDGRPVVCLPGLSRTLEDFQELSASLASAAGGSRRVIAISARGRGLSDRDPEPDRYQVPVEAADAVIALSSLAIEETHVVGTSRGGLQAMAIAAMRPGLIKGLVLNDVGPVLEPEGLSRIRDQLRQAGEPPASMEAAAARIEAAQRPWFPALSADDFERWARRSWRDDGNGLAPTFDPALAGLFDALDLDRPLEPLWRLFDALADIPLMVVRGELSDILSETTLSQMRARRPDLVVHVTPGQGHAPLLEDAPTMQAIAAFLESVDGKSVA